MDLKDEKFITIGTDKLHNELFKKVLRQPKSDYKFKPHGALWASPYYGEDKNVCDWLNFIQKNKCYLENFNVDTGAILDLKENANVCVISSFDDILKLSLQYPSFHHQINYYNQDLLKKKYPIDFERMAEDYDAVYIKLKELPPEMLTLKLLNKNIGEFSEYRIDSLIVFNLNCIKSYNVVDIPRSGLFLVKFHKPILKETNEVQTVTNEYLDLEHYAEKLFQIKKEYIYESKNYREYVENLEYVLELIKNCLLNNKEMLKKIQQQLKIRTSIGLIETINHNIAAKQLRHDDQHYLKKFLK